MASLIQAKEGYWDIPLVQVKSKVSKGEGKKNLPKPYVKRRYYTKADIQEHNKPNDAWVVIFYKVYDITRLIQQNFDNPLSLPLINSAGRDISHWFDKNTKNPKTCVDRETGNQKYYTPEGRFLDVSEQITANQGKQGKLKQGQQQMIIITNYHRWWKQKKRYCIGTLTGRQRKIKLINLLTDHEDVLTVSVIRKLLRLQVPSEETIQEILTRYLEINKHAASYTWKRLGRPLDMTMTLEENDILDETEEFERMAIPEDQWYVPAIHLYFKDDLTVK